ncbi:MAG: hypothetical protein JO125_10855 [Chloroflexi bacterium]|nr:hypothetical protein [Chloroflexota bacterium]
MDDTTTKRVDVDQNELRDVNPPEPREPIQQLPANRIEFVQARIFLFILLLILTLFFNGNPLIFSFITTVLILLSVSMFDPISNTILRYCERLIILPGRPLAHLWHSFFRNHFTSLGRWLKLHSRLVTEVVSIFAIAVLLAMTTLNPFVTRWSGNINDFFCLKTSLPWFTCNSGYGVSALHNGVRIGLIKDNTVPNTVPFDQSTLNHDEINIENLIFAENRQACIGQHITLVAATMLSRTVEDPLSGATLGLQNLQGYYLWQHSYNAMHPSTRLCLVIANLGTPDTANKGSSLVKGCPDCYSMPQVIYQIAQLAHSDPNVRGIVGFPYSEQAKEALDALKNYPSLANLSIISPSASSDNFSNTNNFYRIDAPDQSQGATMAHFFCSHLAPRQSSSASIAILIDNSDAFSGDLPLDFKNNLSCIDQEKIPPLINYTNGDSQSIQAAVDRALKQNRPNYIFFPGYDEDMDTVEAEIHRQNHSNTVTILGGDGLNNVDATTTHYAYSLVYAASFAQPLPLSDAIVRNFSERFSNPYFAKTSNGLWMPKDTLLAIDAAHAFTEALQNLQQGDFTQQDFNTALKSVYFTGESGEILFQGNRVNSGHISDRDQEIVYITCYDHSHTINLIGSYTAIIDTGSVQENRSAQDTNSCT